MKHIFRLKKRIFINSIFYDMIIKKICNILTYYDGNVELRKITRICVVEKTNANLICIYIDSII